VTLSSDSQKFNISSVVKTCIFKANDKAGELTLVVVSNEGTLSKVSVYKIKDDSNVATLV